MAEPASSLDILQGVIDDFEIGQYDIRQSEPNEILPDDLKNIDCNDLLPLSEGTLDAPAWDSTRLFLDEWLYFQVKLENCL